MASKHEIRARHTEEKQKQNPQERFKKNMAVVALVGMTAAAAIGVFAKEYFLDYGDITVEATEDGNFVSYTDEHEEFHEREENTDGEIIITQDSEEAVKNTLTIDAEEDQTVEVTIRDVNIDATEKIDPDTGYTKDNYEAAISIKGAGDVVLELDGDNVVKSGDYHAGVETAGTGMLTIEDEDRDGSLDATGADYGAGIGGGDHEDGNVTINGGEITATGGYGGAGIGSGYWGSSNVTINGGTIEAIGSVEYNTVIGGAGIGNGGISSGYLSSISNTITINGGEITAIGAGSGAGIGAVGVLGASTIEINGGTIYAESSSYCGGGNGIGGRGTGTMITINGGNITAIGSSHAGIGGTKSTTVITGGEINAVGGEGSAGIGGEKNASANVTIMGGNVTATAGKHNIKREEPADAIGSGDYNKNGDKPQSAVVYDGGTIIEQPYGWDANGHTHAWEVSEYTAPTYEAKGVEISLCECGSKKTEFLPALVSEKYLPLTVTTLLSTAQPYERSMADGRVIFAAPAENAILTGSLGALAELKAQGATTLVFRTQLCETSVSIDKILSAGSEDDVFALTHKGTEVVLTVEGRVVE